MTPRAGKKFRRLGEDLAIKHRHAAGIDVHSVPALFCSE